MHNKLKVSVTALCVAITASQVAHGGLFAVDTGDTAGNYLAENGFFAAWYQDTHGRTLDLCLSKNLSSRVPSTPGAPSYMCSLLPNPGIFDDAQPLVFPTNFPDEAFWFTADAEIVDAASGIDLSYGSALEAAFGGDVPAPNDQISFARVRIRVDVPSIGTYTVTHPYGVEIFEVTAEDFDTDGDRAINMTRDIGIGVPLTYTGALAGDVGPFLRSVNGPYTETDPDTGAADTFIGDPNVLEPVTGSPFNTNYIRIEGPGGIDLSTDVFAISGKLSTVVRPTPAMVERATYSRSDDSQGIVSAQQDVFVSAPPPPGKADYLDANGDEVVMSEADSTGHWYGQSTLNPSVPATITVTADNSLAIASSTVTTVASPLVDHVVIQKAEYSLSSGTLTVHASSSDEMTIPTLSVHNSDGDLIAPLSGGVMKTLTTNITPIPPAAITVSSSNGGSDTEEVIILP
ncbi:hypothetical protein ACIGCM_02930 [Pseudomonas sp. NPDC078700]|uniref:hypothetical protein n=1 Tax=Pseudomonas sp. NPDC078700 TaxID=3364424 RepID=UPI0037C64C98